MSDLELALLQADAYDIDGGDIGPDGIKSMKVLATEVRRLQAQKHLDDQTYAALKAELAALKDGGKRLLTKLCNESRRAEKAESDLASAQTKIEAQSKRISWMAGDALKAKDDLAAAKAKYDEMHDARFAEARKVDALNADLSQARSECARKDEAIRSALDWLDTIHHRANDTYMRLSHALSKDDDWLSRQIAEARRPLVEVLQYARRMVRLDPDQVQQKIDEFLRGQEK